MFDKSIETEKGTIYYRIKDDKVSITSYSGRDTELIIPDHIEEYPVRKISKKAFLNSKALRKLVLPDTIRKLSDWAFAHCQNLDTLELPRKGIKLGRGVFTGDEKLRRIELIPRPGEEDTEVSMTDKEKEDTSVLLAEVSRMKNVEYLLDFKEAGSKDWFRRLDMALMDILKEADEEGHTEMILCGEEDIDCTIESFVAERRREKSRVSFMRLIHDFGISDSLRTAMTDYIKSHTVGSESSEAWEVLLNEKNHIPEYYKLFLAIGAINDKNFDDALLSMGDKAPEMKAYFMREHVGSGSEESFFDQFSL